MKPSELRKITNKVKGDDNERVAQIFSASKIKLISSVDDHLLRLANTGSTSAYTAIDYIMKDNLTYVDLSVSARVKFDGLARLFIEEYYTKEGYGVTKGYDNELLISWYEEKSWKQTRQEKFLN